MFFALDGALLLVLKVLESIWKYYFTQMGLSKFTLNIETVSSGKISNELQRVL